MDLIKKWIQTLAYIIWGIPWRPSDYRRALSRNLQELALKHNLSLTIIGSLDIHFQFEFLHVKISGAMPPIVILYWISKEDLTMMGQKTPDEAYLCFKSETRFMHLVEPKALAHLILQQARALAFSLNFMQTQNAA